ncbi:MAG: 3-deoxy-8-phosphooctulonate synthase [Candidatus Kapabacteria bacterium]|nr:3-deoxy-8-phosphooctulonate synthase [Ignavibacteriota bacterium]MCW5884478.1 3-deoxy-8-phosphooctulonate synthase [Candidatus Kapabacteria bacterium]
MNSEKNILDKIIIIAGPCLAESEIVINETAETLASLTQNAGIEFYFKASYRKANRSSINSISGMGDLRALSWIKSAAEKYNLRTLTDIHSAEEAKIAAKYVDCLQIPAFLARQTDILLTAGDTGKFVNIKKGQFMAPEDMHKAAAKVKSTGNEKIWLTERGTTFGYHDLVVDYRGLVIMAESGYPVIFDATHSVQKPSIGEQSGGSPKFIEKLTRAALAVGVDGIFFETHPDPKNALSDSATQLPLDKAGDFIDSILRIHNFFKNQ